MSIFSKVRVTVLGHINELLDKAIDLNSIPVVKQYIRDLEDALAKLKHEAALAAANVTTLKGQKTDLEKAVAQDKLRAKAFLDQKNETAARQVASRIADNQSEITALDEQIATATTASQQMDAAVERLNSKHDQMLRQLRTLQTQDRSAHAMEQATGAMKAAAAVTSSVDGVGVDNLAQRIKARSDAATEEFNRTVGEVAPAEAEDPLKTAQVDDILNSLR